MSRTNPLYVIMFEWVMILVVAVGIAKDQFSFIIGGLFIFCAVTGVITIIAFEWLGR